MRWWGWTLAIVVTLATAYIYRQLLAIETPHVDRLRGSVAEPLPIVQKLVAVVTATVALAILFLLVTRLRHTPAMTRDAAMGAALFLDVGLLHLYWVVCVAPFQWTPRDFDRSDWMIEVRPCRGATLWAYARRGYEPVATIDEVWLHFAGPRNGGAPTFAVSAAGRRQEKYHWLNSSDLFSLRMRKDAPALVRCDSQSLPERVSPEPWHDLGFRW